MYRVTSIIAILFFYFESGSALLCEASKNPLCTLDQWRTNVLCRINGGAPGTATLNGYLSRLLESVPTTREEQAIKLEILDIFLQGDQLLSPNFDSRTGPEKEFILEHVESKLNKLMPKLPVTTATVAGRQVEVKWTSTTCLSNEATSVAVPCGWFTQNYDPVCPIV